MELRKTRGTQTHAQKADGSRDQRGNTSKRTTIRQMPEGCCSRNAYDRQKHPDPVSVRKADQKFQNACIEVLKGSMLPSVFLTSVGYRGKTHR
ncbi:hypothetical protein BaRGS_00019511 [Batillaria attramentaria]|uniref:Uncharacterized protein n=1 Tax=Batillaria attramentaria TaxID=370345 RepID=A0ABD0KQ52_9CAEN